MDSTEDNKTSESGAITGLTSEKASELLKQYGYNTIKEKKINPALKFLSSFWGPIPWMLETAVILEITAGVYQKNPGKFLESAIIFGLLLFNNVVAFFQERKAQSALELLKRKLAVKASALRDGSWVLLDAAMLVPGDVIHLKIGDFVPADVNLIGGHVQLDQSALTGESLPVEAGTGKTAYSGSVVKKGEATGTVAATGENSYFGKTAELVNIVKTKSNLSKLIFSIVKYLIIIDLVLAAFFIIYSSAEALFPIIDSITFILVILIAAVPVALPATYTLSTALGAIELAKKGVLTARLSAIEESAAMTVLCSDKTGTLTENNLALEDIVPVEDYAKEELLKYAVMASEELEADALDSAIFKAAKSMNVKPEGILNSFVPFDPGTKRTQAIYNTGGETLKIYKGQPKIIWGICMNGGQAPADFKYENIEKDLELKGRRVLAVAREKSGMVDFIGFLGFIDPERKDSRLLIDELKEIGVRVIMLTGDTPSTAVIIAKRLNIGERVCDRNTLLTMSNDKNEGRELANYDVFAGIYPEDKYHIAKALQDNGYVVGMTGDGVNDSPALKQAEVGIAVSGSTDVAKAAASIVLTNPGLLDIVSAVKTSREIFQRMATWILNKIAKTVEISFFTILGVIFTGSFIITPKLVILLIFTNDFVTMSISTDNVKYSKKPNRWNVKNMIMGSVPMGAFELLFSFGALFYLELIRYPIGQIRTIVFLIMVFTGQGVLYLVRTGGRFYKTPPSKYMLLATIGDLAVVSLMAVFGILMARISPAVIALLFGLSAVYLFFIDAAKIRIFKAYDVRL